MRARCWWTAFAWPAGPTARRVPCRQSFSGFDQICRVTSFQLGSFILCVTGAVSSQQLHGRSQAYEQQIHMYRCHHCFLRRHPETWVEFVMRSTKSCEKHARQNMVIDWAEAQKNRKCSDTSARRRGGTWGDPPDVGRRRMRPACVPYALWLCIIHLRFLPRLPPLPPPPSAPACARQLPSAPLFFPSLTAE